MQNAQAERSRQYIETALLDLMARKPFDAITITDITKKAGVARLTFYRHYESKEQVILEYYNSIFEKYFEENFISEKFDLNEALRRCFDYWRQEEKIVKLLVGQNMGEILAQPFAGYLERMQSVKDASHNKFHRRFLEGGMLATLIAWVMDPDGRTSQEMANMIEGLINLDQF